MTKLTAFWIFFYSIIIASWLILYFNMQGMMGIGNMNHHLHMHHHHHSDISNIKNIFTMWALMVIAMMVPTIIPYLGFYQGLKKNENKQVTQTHLFLFTSSYVLSWLIYAILGTLAHYLLSHYGWADHHGTITSPYLSLILIGFVAIYNILPSRFKSLSQCQSPLHFFMRFWKPGHKTAFILGARHAINCLNCCAALMLLMFVGAMADLRLMLLLTAIMVIEKFSISGKILSYIVSFLLICWAIWIMFTL